MQNALQNAGKRASGAKEKVMKSGEKLIKSFSDASRDFPMLEVVCVDGKKQGTGFYIFPARGTWEAGLRTRFFGEYSNLSDYRILHAKHTVG